MNRVIYALIVGYSLVFTVAYAKNKSIYSMKSNKIKRPEDLLGPARQEEEFLKNISAIESSSGKDTDHDAIQEGLHAGDSAVGEFGLMPNTIRELATRLKRRDPRLNLDKSFGGDPQIEQYANPNIDQETLQFAMESDPEMVNRAARYMEQLVKTRYQNPDKMAYAWNMGHNIDPAKLTEDKLAKSPYVGKFRTLRKKVSKK